MRVCQQRRGIDMSIWDTLGGMFGLGSGPISTPQTPTPDMSAYNQYLAQFNQGGGDVSGAMALDKSAAMGQQPSAAQGMMQQGFGQAMANAGAQAASARGNFGLANAQQTAAQTQAQLGQQAATQGGILRAQEMATARDQYTQAALQNRAQQLQAAGMTASQAMAQAQLEMQGNAQQMQAQQANNDAYNKYLGMLLGAMSGGAMSAGAAGGSGGGGAAASSGLAAAA